MQLLLELFLQADVILVLLEQPLLQRAEGPGARRRGAPAAVTAGAASVGAAERLLRLAVVPLALLALARRLPAAHVVVGVVLRAALSGKLELLCWETANLCKFVKKRRCNALKKLEAGFHGSKDENYARCSVTHPLLLLRAL